MFRKLALAAAAALTLAGIAIPVASAASGPQPSYLRFGAPRPLARATPPVAFHSHPIAHVPAFGSVTSGNWAGYAAFGNHFRFVEADYSIPSVNCAASPDGSQEAVWAGLDGFGNSTVEQEGTFAECSGGSASYFAFWEMFPNPAVVFTNVSPGDAIHVSTYFASGHWNLQLVDRTTGGGFQVSETCTTCKNASAEVISETPNGGPPAGLLADFGQAGFNHIGVTSSTGTRGNMLSTLWKEDSITEVSPATNATMQTVSGLEGPAGGANGGYGNQAFTALARNSGG